MDEIVSHLTGDFLISSPSIKLKYSNSFAIPIEITLNATGKRQLKTVDLGLAPITIACPVTPSRRDVSDSLTIDKNNSSLPELISLPPGEVSFSGSAKMNPLGNNGLRNNYVFGESRFLGSLEVEMPLEFRINNLQFTDTLDKFIKNDNGNNDTPVNPEDFELFRLDLLIKNGFPLGAAIKLSLYDSVTRTIKSTVEAKDLLGAAPIDLNGRANGTTETETKIELTKEFFSAASKADKIIVRFTLNTTNSGLKDVKIYSDYRIDFNAALVLKPSINFKQN
jgi:hypothetical protein